MRDLVAGVRVLIVGDVMLDEYWFGDVRRISPEAPVPIVHVTRSDVRPGGAANVARNVVSLGAQATLLSVVGADATADRLRDALDEAGVAHRLNVDPGIRTTLKLRLISQNQQMLRVDFEEAPSHESLEAKRADFEEIVTLADIVILSDYGKGALHAIEALIAIARRHGKTVLVDPKGQDYQRYAGATAVTPNRAELSDAVGGWSNVAEMDDKAEALRARLGMDALLLTMSEQGMKLYREGHALHQPARASEVFDVSGAGDTMIAGIAVMLGSGRSWEEAVAFANTAAGIAVGKLGTSIVEFNEVINARPPLPASEKE
ncbi:D-glycero-beta-D-manno-heptose-7-phosphate kinase [Sphingomonas paeninsulae]|uniref:D-glycero-beta-D-manno-heptose-7-phosphate kinase n=1 Tax=Sphingomonas paeninsulae TaxID=2319844 RepID=A0A494TPU7_SPHPE|nr:D-glycero-beta-D-manno-heptose-7-phosphate kinase [Sphingomonas paeninsulae]AYJ87125.1 D-glycero-beta-D-manno-heptose-7-phosphate kinase [Sphingomonas paeninsulae]